jgi:hypothetical protein
MDALVDHRGQANWGCFDEPMRFNPEDFRLRDRFGRELGGLRRRLAFGAFTYLGILTDRFTVGLAAVRLGYAAQVFGFIHDHDAGSLRQWGHRGLPGAMAFGLDPEACAVRYRGGACRLALDKGGGRLEVAAGFGPLRLEAAFACGPEQRPLRVVNPSCGDPNRFTFTEKCAPLRPERLALRLDGAELPLDLGRAAALLDWTAGYFNRNTNWLWAALAGVLADGTPVGANFAALVNESFYPENAYWLGGERIRVAQVIFRYDTEDPGREPWRIFTEDGRVDLTFRATGERGERTRLPFLKVNFRQFMGEYAGTLRDGKGGAVAVTGLRGLAEVHQSVW